MDTTDSKLKCYVGIPRARLDQIEREGGISPTTVMRISERRNGVPIFSDVQGAVDCVVATLQELAKPLQGKTESVLLCRFYSHWIWPLHFVRYLAR